MQKRFWILIALLLVVTLTVVACGSDDDKNSDTSRPATFTTLDAQAAYNRFSKNGSAIIVDVRQPEEWAATGIPTGAQLIPLPEFDQRAPNELPKDKEIYVICNSGNRSVVAAQSLISLGYPDVVNIDGGIQAWLRASLPVEPYSP